MRLVPFKTNSFTNDTHFMVSDESYDLVTSGAGWRVAKGTHKDTRSSYYRIERSATTKEKAEGWSENIRLHRWILGLKESNGLVVDHARNWLDNTLESLRKTTSLNNSRNSKAPVKRKKENQELPKGVKREPNSKKNPFSARIRVKGKETRLGSFPTAEKAYEAYCKAALQYFGEYAKFN